MSGIPIPPTVPPTPLMLSDNSANVQVACNSGSAGRVKHELRRYWQIEHARANDEVMVRHVLDGGNASDFVTKFVPAAKYKASVDMCTNVANMVPP